MPVSAEYLKSHYTFVHGDERNLTGSLKVADLHVHIWGDSTDTPRRIIKAVAERLDVVAITNHDNDGYEKASRIRDKKKYPLEIIRAAEVTARPLADNDPTHKGKHVLVYNYEKLPLCHMPLPKLLENADRQNAFTSLAHPTLGNMSYDANEVQTMVEEGFVPHFLEVHNGGAAMIDVYKPKLEKYKHLPLIGAINRKIPDSSNRVAKALHDQMSHAIQGATGGSDAHSARSVASVITAYPENMGLFDAIKQGKSVIMEKKKFPRATLTGIVLGGRGAKRLDRMRETGEIAVYQESPSEVLFPQ